jgi:hypothetical protein
VAKSFLFGQDSDAFEVEVDVNYQFDRLEKELDAWRKKGPVSNFYDVVVFIRRILQRREAFPSLFRAVDGEVRELFGEDTNILLI